MTVQALADRCAELGLPLARLTITKLESGRRQAVTPAEVMVLAVALEVSPIELILPVGLSENAEVLPGIKIRSMDAVHWFAGKLKLESRNGVTTLRWPSVNEESAPGLLEAHVDLVRRWAEMRTEAAQVADVAAQVADVAADETYSASVSGEAVAVASEALLIARARQAELQYRVTALDNFREAAAQSLRRIRAQMRERGMILPPLPAGLDIGDDGEEVADGPH